MYSYCKEVIIYCDNYENTTEHVREGSRAIIMKDNKILLSHETKIDQWMIPGGGLEEGETLLECCIREAGEETGLAVEAKTCYLKIDEYFADWNFINYYFICEVTGTAEIKLTEREIQVGAVCKWVDFEEAVKLFERYQEFTGVNEGRKGLYFREYTALMEFIKINSR